MTLFWILRGLSNKNTWHSFALFWYLPVLHILLIKITDLRTCWNCEINKIKKLHFIDQSCSQARLFNSKTIKNNAIKNKISFCDNFLNPKCHVLLKWHLTHSKVTYFQPSNLLAYPTHLKSICLRQQLLIKKTSLEGDWQYSDTFSPPTNR